MDKLPHATETLNRRNALKLGFASMAALAAGKLILRVEAAPTEASGTLGSYANYAKPIPNTAPVHLAPKPAPKLLITEDNILGPFYRSDAPFRAKITPPLEPGKVVLVSGTVWGYDTKKPLPRATIDIWQASANGRYDNDDPHKPPQKGVFRNRARLVTDENGYYEFETVHPGAYQIGANMWRPSHIHYMVQHPGHKPLVTQLYFEGDPHNKTDEFIKASLIRPFHDVKAANGAYETAVFDIVLDRT